MAMINCPECGKEISEKASQCPNCGCPSSEWTKSEVKEEDKSKYVCGFCHKQNEPGRDFCMYCGAILGKSYESKPAEEEKKKFEGVYRSTLFHGLQEVYCPRCGSENCQHYKEQKIIPGKTKTKYTANLNPLKPFTLVNKKEKVVRKEEVVTEDKFMCNKCGMIFN